MLVKRGDGKILNVIKDGSENLNDDKAKKALEAAKNIVENGNKTDSTLEAEKQ